MYITYKNYQAYLYNGDGKFIIRNKYDELIMINGDAPKHAIHIKNWNGTVSIPGVLNMAKESDVLFILSGREINEPKLKDSALLVNRDYEKDIVTVEYTRLNLNDIIDLDVNGFPWYDSDEWDQTRDIPLAIATIKEAIVAFGINYDGNFTNMRVNRIRKDVQWYLECNFDSLIYADGESATFKLPHQFSDIVTITALNGFIYSPIIESSVNL